MVLSPRKSSILETVVREFINTGESVSSSFLYEKYDFDIKPAMIRWELSELSRLGFLEQPHRSGGRIPTDRGYEFFVGLALEKESSFCDRKAKRFFNDSEWSKLASYLSKKLNLISVINPVKENAVYKNGLEYLVESIEWESPKDLGDVIRDFEYLDNRLKNIRNNITDLLKVFVGKSPITKSPKLSVVVGYCKTRNGRVIIGAVGSKRMDYERTIKIFRGLTN